MAQSTKAADPEGEKPPKDGEKKPEQPTGAQPTPAPEPKTLPEAEKPPKDGEKKSEQPKGDQPAPTPAPETKTLPEGEKPPKDDVKKPDDAKPSDTKPSAESGKDSEAPQLPEDSADPKPTEAKAPYSNDPQLQMAIDHLAEELAKAE